MTKVDTTQSDRELWDAATTPASSRDDSMSESSEGDLQIDEDPDPELRRGAFVGRYQIIERLGAGGMGVVYRAHDPQLDRQVALKLLRSARSGEQVAVLRMLREAQSAAKIRHPNVVTVYDAGEVDGHVFIAMELMRGTDLAKWFGRHPAWREVVHVMLQAAQGLRAAHEVGLIHRDFKPDNVVLEDDGNVKVLDFGLARTAYDAEVQSRSGKDSVPQLGSAGTHAHVKLTRTGALTGTLAYMAPEQYEHQTLDARTDQFSFCVTLFMGVYGYRPFAGRTPGALAANILSGTIELPEDPSVAPKQLLEVLRKGLAPDPNDRFASMDELIAALQVILNHDEGRRIGPEVRRWSILTGLSVVVVASAIGWIAQQRDWGGMGAAPTPVAEPLQPTPAPDEDADLEVELAAGRGRNEPVDGPQIWISSDTLRFIAKPGGPHHDIELRAGLLTDTTDTHGVPALIEVLATMRPTTGSDPLTLFVDRQTPVSTIVRTIASGTQAGFERYDFAVLTDGQTRVLEIQRPIDNDGDAQRHRVAIELGIQPDRVRVGARASTSDEPKRWPLDAGAGSCELSVEPASASLDSLGRLGAQLCQLDAVSLFVVVGADEDVTWEQLANVLSATIPSLPCSRGVVIEAGIQAIPDCATPIAAAELGTKLAGGTEFRQWCFINSRLRSRKDCRPTQAACIAEATHWVDNPRRSCRGEP